MFQNTKEKERAEHSPYTMCVHPKLLQSFGTLCNPMDYITHQALASMGVSRKEYWSGLPYPPPVLAGGFFTTSATWEAPHPYTILRGVNNTPTHLK